MKIMGRAIREARLQLGLSQQELAEGITTQATISLIENQNQMPKIPILISISQRLSISIDQIIKNSDGINRNLEEVENYSLNGNSRSAENLFNDIKSKKISNNNQRRYWIYLNALINLNNKRYDDVLYFVEQISRYGINDRYMMMSKAIAGVVWVNKNDLMKAEQYFAEAIDSIANIDGNDNLQFYEKIYVYEMYVEYLIEKEDLNLANQIIKKALKILRDENQTYRLANFYLLQSKRLIKLKSNPSELLHKAKFAAEISSSKSYLNEINQLISIHAK